ncbi:MAG: hypothetical protein K6G67_01230 [Lachnospiraceae bacterium]|jgi:hypothetical protein|nr:hypothetical protein [Lachnospiraceae bacterium]
MNTKMRKIVVGIATVVIAFSLNITDVSAASLTKNTVVYITKTGSTYHLKSDCSSADSKRTYAKTLYDILKSGNYKMCKTCAKEYGVDINDSQNLTLEMLPYELGSHVSSSGTEESASTNETEGSLNGNESSNNNSSNNNSSEGSKNDSGSESINSNGSNSKTESSEITSTGSESSGNGSGDSKDKQSSQNSQNTQTSQKDSSKKTTVKNSSGVKELMTQKQRRNKFLSKSNPKRGAKPKTSSRPESDGYEYADFAKYNSYNSDNGLGGTPIYLAGRIKDIQPVKENGSMYSLAVMVDDTDGYQWYMRCNCSKKNFDSLKVDLLGKDASIFGTYAGYSGVTNRPMMDILRVVDNEGNDIDMSIYK